MLMLGCTPQKLGIINGTIQVLLSGDLQQIAKPHLRKIAAEIGVNLLNRNSQPKNTRQLGSDIIDALQERAP